MVTDLSIYKFILLYLLFTIMVQFFLPPIVGSIIIIFPSYFLVKQLFRFNLYGTLGFIIVLILDLLIILFLHFNLDYTFENSSWIYDAQLFYLNSDKVIRVFNYSIHSVLLCINIFLLAKNKSLREPRMGSQEGQENYYFPIKMLNLMKLFLIIVSILFLYDIAFLPTIIDTPYNSYPSRLSNIPIVSSYYILIFPGFLFYLLLLKDFDFPKSKVIRYLYLITILSLFGLLTGSRSLFSYIFVSWGIYFYLWDTSNSKKVKIFLVGSFGYIISLIISYIRGYTLLGFINKFDFAYVKKLLVSPLEFPIIGLAPYQTATVINFGNENFLLTGLTYINTFKMILPEFVYNLFGLSRPVGTATLYQIYAPSAGGINLIAEAFWNYGYWGVIIVPLIISAIIILIDISTLRLKNLGKAISLMLGYFAFIGVGYGISTLSRVLQLSILFIIAFKVMQRRQNNNEKI